MYMKLRQSEGDTRSPESLIDEAKSVIQRLQSRGLDIGYGHDGAYGVPEHLNRRLHQIYDSAKEVIFQTLSPEFEKVFSWSFSLRLG